jgi:hypothetical protein
MPQFEVEQLQRKENFKEGELLHIFSNQTIRYRKQNKLKVGSYCYLTHLINNKTIKYTKQNHSNCSKCPPWDSMHFSARISSNWVASAMVSW